ncbi:SixA phosphatase family protein [Enterovirga aerilata]|uniref:Histidine phosphatase family protein n=1 Tax=Enterovirga aerilata TaxID=2730920 RepID=A0A849IBB0_9HYPH|nr:histidine phosphatase family protein [Enterovirga sp. DB1703]NNM74688.1 histidine phosphatase family protein [Enterovirga sp. DB1703]
MKRLVLLRHAKAVGKDAARDFDRVLAPRGRAQMEVVARHLASMPLDLALVSPSARTRETWELARRPEVPVRFDRRIYEASEPELLKVAQEAEPSSEALVLVGHNPAFEELARDLVRTGDEAGMGRLLDGMPTAAVAVIAFEIDSWRRLSRKTGRLLSFETPASLGFERDD